MTTRKGHSVCLVASSENHEAATGADVYLEIDGKEFEASSFTLEAKAGSEIVYANVRFAVKELKVSVQAEAKVDQVDGVTDSVRGITIDTKVDNFMCLMGLDLKPVITEPVTKYGCENADVGLDKATSKTLNSLYIQAEAGEPVYAYLCCNPFKKVLGDPYPPAELNIKELVKDEQLPN